MSTISHSQPRNLLWVEQILLTLALGAALFTAVLLALVFGYQAWHVGRIFPGVSIGGIEVGGMTPAAAAAQVTQQFTFPQTGRILLTDGQQRWLVTPAEMGLYLDPQATAENAYRIGRKGSLAQRLTAQFSLNAADRELPPALILDERTAFAYLSNLARQIDRPTIEASIQLTGVDVQTTPGQVGRRVDIPATLALLRAQVERQQDGIVPLTMVETPPTILDASAQAEEARRILSQPLTITLPASETDPLGPWVIDPPTLAKLLVVEPDGGRYHLALDATRMRETLNGFSGDLQRAPQNARFVFNDTTRQLELIQPAVIGRAMDVQASFEQIQSKLLGGEHTIPLQFVFTQPQITDQANGEQLGVRELVHAETSYFYGSSASRVQNITAAAKRFHGLLVAPGQTFSMAQNMGDISLDNGYAEAMIIYGGKTIKGVGGGVCQVSTTLFRAAFFAGFPIVERYAHAYRVYYYEKVAGNRINPRLAGLDATVFVPLVDFKFTNNTPYWLLMETYVNPAASSITWKFYSTSDGRSVSWDTTGPIDIVPAPEPEYHENPDLANGEIKQVDWAAEGADVNVTRTVTRDGAVILQDAFKTHYEPWRDVYEYGPGTEIPPPPPPPPG